MVPAAVREDPQPHPGWFGGVMATSTLASLSLAAPGVEGVVERTAHAVGVLLLVLSVAAFLLLLAVLVRSLTAHGGGMRARVVAPVTGPLYAALPGSLITMSLALWAWRPELLERQPVVITLAVVGTLAAAAGVWLTIVFFVDAIERDDFDVITISGTWFIPETVILLGVILLSVLARASSSESLATTLAALTMALMGAGFILFLLTAALFFARLVMTSSHAHAGIAAIWIMMSPMSVSSMALEGAADVLPLLASADEQQVRAFISVGAGALWGFALWWLVTALALTRNAGAQALVFTPGSWSFVFPMAALSLATVSLSRLWESDAILWLALLLSSMTAVMWCYVAAGAVRWVAARIGEVDG